MDKRKALSEIAREIQSCPLCRKWGEGLPVPGEGNPDADTLFVGEAPGREEAKTGRPFVGRSGQLLRSAIRGIGLNEEDVFITSPVKYRPRSGTPNSENVLHGRQHFLKQLSIIEPKILVLMGSIACRGVLGEKVEVSKVRGSLISFRGMSCLVTFHPAYALRFPAGRREFLRDFKKLKRLIQRLKAKETHEQADR